MNGMEEMEKEDNIEGNENGFQIQFELQLQFQVLLFQFQSEM